MRLWLKKNWLLLLAMIVGISVFGGAWLLEPNPNKESSRYMLSAMAQVIGTVFVLTIAVIQIVGSRRVIKLEKLISQRYFQVTAVVSFFGIVLPLAALYFNRFCIVTAFCLGLGVTSLLVIGWFIVRVTYAKDLVAAEEEVTPEKELQTKSLIDLKRRALESLSLRISSNAMEVITELLRRAKERLPEGTEGKQIVRDACVIIRDIASDRRNNFPEVWEMASDSLIEIDNDARKQEDFDFSGKVTIPNLTDIATKHKFKENPGWPKTKEYLFECLHEDILNKRIDIDKSLERGKITTPLLAIIQILASIFSSGKWKMAEEICDRIYKEYREALPSYDRTQREDIPKIFALIIKAYFELLFFQLTKGGFSSGSIEERNFKSKIDTNTRGFAESANIKIDRLVNKRLLNFINSGKYNILGVAPDFKTEEFNKLKQRLGIA